MTRQIILTSLLSLAPALLCGILVYVSNGKRAWLYAQYRDLDHMPENSRPVRQLNRWGFVGYWAGKARTPVLILGVGAGALALFTK